MPGRIDVLDKRVKGKNEGIKKRRSIYVALNVPDITEATYFPYLIR